MRAINITTKRLEYNLHLITQFVVICAIRTLGIPPRAYTYYEERLRKLLGPTPDNTINTRRLRADLLEVFKILKQHDEVNLEYNTNTTWEHQYKLLKTRTRFDIRKYTFSCRIVNEWNKLSKEAVQSTK